MISKYVLVLCSSACIFLLPGCGAESDDSNEGETISLVCGPNGTLHGGLGNAEPHCDCNDGFAMYDGNCVPENSQGPGGGSSNGSDGNGAAGNSNSNSGGADTSEMSARALPASCWRPRAQNGPREAVGCDVATDETCDIAQMGGGQPNIACLPGPNPQGLGDSCQPSGGPFCAAGLRCAPPGICKKFCCEDSDCSDGLRCQAFSAAAGSLGLCDDASADAPRCGSAGASCRTGSECCSNDCHAGHCH